MLAARNAIEESGAYVAFEFVTGTLHGKQGSFILQHMGPCAKASIQWTSRWFRIPGPASCPASAAR